MNEASGQEAAGRRQRTEKRIANCGFKNKAEDRNSLVGAAFSRDLAI
jgi:hypothetical protein